MVVGADDIELTVILAWTTAKDGGSAASKQGACAAYRNPETKDCQTAWKNGQGIRESSVENCLP
ncbi:MAG: hypothetical protein O2966_00435 [Proteobacteria bacterium]|nr:hypothetical protein [Pseudomonadota bacterium]